MIEDKYYNIDKENLTKSDFWTNELYRTAYNNIEEKDRCPLVIPSYNRPENIISKYIFEYTKDDEQWPVVFVVRESQEVDYKESYYIKNNSNIYIISFPDKEINDIGKTRAKIVDYFKAKSFPFIFISDDDNFKFFYSLPFTRSTGTRISYYYHDNNSFPRFMAMWQTAMQQAVDYRNNVIISCPMIAGFSWVDKFCDIDLSIKYVSGPQVALTCLNMNAIRESGLNYKTIKDNGHEDKDFLIRALLDGYITAEFRWLTYFNGGMKNELLKTSSIEERFKQQYEEMRKNFPDVEFIKWITNKKLYNVGIHWSRALKYHNENFKDDVIEKADLKRQIKV